METEALYRSIEFYDNFNKLTINFVPFGGTTVGLPGDSCTSGRVSKSWHRRTRGWRSGGNTAEEIVTVLRQVEVAIANGRATPHACREAGITEQSKIGQCWGPGESSHAAALAIVG